MRGEGFFEYSFIHETEEHGEDTNEYIQANVQFVLAIF